MPTIRIVPAFFPAAVLLAFSFWLGTFHGGGRGTWTVASHVLLLAVAVAAGPGWRDPLRCGRTGNLLLAVLGIAIVLSWYQSPVARAGRVGLALLPVFLLFPSFVERCWTEARGRALGLRSVAAAVAAVALWSLVQWWPQTALRASFPLGHHNLVAAWLVALLPLAALPWRDGGVWRALAAGSTVLGLGVLVAARSIGAFVALAVVLAVAAVLATRTYQRLLAVLLAAAIASPLVPRLGDISAGHDSSLLARRSYLAAGWRGLLERPLLGWGPGASRWTISEHLVPVPGLHPPDVLVTSFHSLPVQLAYELGVVGTALVLAIALFFLRHHLRMPGGRDPGLRRAALLGFLGWLIASAVGRPFDATTLPLTAVLLLGALYAAGSPPDRGGRWRHPWVLALVAGAVLLPIDLAHLAWDRAREAEDPAEQLALLERAVRLDPDFPLYRLHHAVRSSRADVEPRAAAREALDAAVAARDLAPFWLLAGRLAQEADEPWAEDAWLEACRLNPLGALAPYRLAAHRPDDPRAVDRAGRALLGHPVLLAAEGLRDRRTRMRAAHRVEGLRGVDAGWRLVLLEAARTLPSNASPEIRRLVLQMDADPATSPSLFAFRRTSWPITVDEVRLDAGAVAGLPPRLGPATVLPGTAADIFDRACGLP